MAWKERLENIKFTIKTGDGSVYYPLWRDSVKSTKLNFAKYDFINVKGSFIDRKESESGSFPLNFYFTGEDNLDQAKAFENSAKDKRLWTITHPFYGTLSGHPTNIERNDNSFGNTEINVLFWESIADDYPEDSDSIPDEVEDRVVRLNSLGIQNYVSKAQPQTGDINDLKSSIEISAARFEPDKFSFNDYRALKNKALGDLNLLIQETLVAISTAQLVLSEPANFERNIRNKIDSVKSAYDEVKSTINQENRQSKYYFESQAATLIANLAKSSVNPLLDDYILRSDIESVNSELFGLYNDYLATIDANQIPLENINDEYSPDIDLQSSLIDLVTYTSQSLFVLSFDARQERSVILEKDSNLIVLTHRFLGLASDENLEIFKRINKIGLSEIYRIKKGRLITYYI
jgi:hypothetical protein